LGLGAIAFCLVSISLSLSLLYKGFVDSSGHANVGSFHIYSFSASKASCCSVPHSKEPEHLNTLKKGKLRSAIFAMNKFSATIFPVNLCTSFQDPRSFMWTIAFILSRLALIPFSDTRQPSNLPILTPNMHFSRLSFSCALCMLVNASARSCN
jgi:hypothetical protein